MQLPWRQQIVEGMLGADLVGFQRPVAAQNFPQICRRLVDVTPTRTAIPLPGPHGAGRRVPRLDRLRPVRRDRRRCPRPRRRRRRCARPRLARDGAARRRPPRLHQGHRRAPAGVPRAARERRHARRRDGARADRGAEPRARDDLPRSCASASSASSASINGEFGRLGHPAIHYQHHNLPREDLCALYAAADVMLVTPLRDGMNLVCKEYVAARHRGGGALVLSEFAGAAGELRRRCSSTRTTSRACARRSQRAISLPDAEAAPTHARAAPPGAPARCPPLRAHVHEALASAGVNAGARTATAAARAGARAARARAGPARRLRLRRHAGADRRRSRRSAPAARVGRGAAGAGRPRPTRTWRSSRAARCATSPRSRGCPRRSTWSAATAASSTSASRAPWRPRRSQLRDRVTKELHAIAAPRPGVLVEPKPAGGACTTARPRPEDGAASLRAVEKGPAPLPGVHARQGKMVIELAVVQADKGHALDALRQQVGATAVLFIGDDVTDEDAFVPLTGPDVGIKVGDGATFAALRVDGPRTSRAARPASPRRGASGSPAPTPRRSSATRCSPTARPSRSSRPTPASPGSATRGPTARRSSPSSSAGHTAGSLRRAPGARRAPTGQRYIEARSSLETRWPGVSVRRLPRPRRPLRPRGSCAC